MAAERAFVEQASAEPAAPEATESHDPTPADAPGADAAEPTADEADSASDAPDSDEGDAQDPQDPADADDADAPAEDDSPDSDADAEGEDDAPADRAAAEAAARALGVTIDDLPPEARPLVEKRLREINAGFTKLRQKDREEITTLKAEQRFQQERPADFVVSLLRAHPQLADEVNAKLDELDGSPTAREAHDIVVRDARAKALGAEHDALTAAAAQARRATEIEDAAKTAARRAGVPFTMGVEDAVAAHVAIHGDIAAADIERIAAEKARAYQASMRAVRREQSKSLAKQKVQDRKSAGLKVKPGTGAAPAPGALPTPTTDEDFITQMAARL